MPSSAGTTRWPNWRDASTPERGWSRCWASAAPARPGWRTRFAWIWLGEFPGGAWFCDLSQARNVDGLVHAVAQGLDVPLGKDDPVVQLGHAIAGRGPCLVILDNFEQIARHAEDTLGRWLDRAAEARFLVTTREVLGLPGEEALALAPLAPRDAAALFMQRAASAKHDSSPAPRIRQRSPNWSSCSMACRWRSSWPRHVCA